MKSRLLLGGGAVIVAAVAIVYWVVDDPTPGPGAPRPDRPTPAAEAPAAPPGPPSGPDSPPGPEADRAPSPATDSEPSGPPTPETRPSEPDQTEADVAAIADNEASQTPTPEEPAAAAEASDGPIQSEATVTLETEGASDVPVGNTPVAEAPAVDAPTVDATVSETPPESEVLDGGETAALGTETPAEDAVDQPLSETTPEPETTPLTELSSDTAGASEVPAPEIVEPAQTPSPDGGETLSEDDQTAAAPSNGDTPHVGQSADDSAETIAERPVGSEQSAAQEPLSTPPVADTGQIDQPEAESLDETGEQAVASIEAPTPSTPSVDTQPVPQIDQTAEIAPSFDAVRVNEDGMIIIAGRAEPGATVTITDNGTIIGTVVADGNGEFVFIGRDSLSPGDHEIGLASVDDGAADPTAVSEQVVLLVVPEPGLTIADGGGANGDADTGALAILVDRDNVGPTEVLQAPSAPAAQSDPPPAEASSSAADGGQADERPSAVDAVPQDAPVADSSQPVVSIDVVDYDDDGRLIIAGRAVPGAAIILYLNNQPVGQTTAAADGRYWLRPDQPVVPGLYTLRADHVGEDGAVIARAETPFQRTASLAGLPDNRQVVVQPGNNLWRLARRIYGQGLQYTVIYQANRTQIRNPDLIYPGQIFMLPAPPEQLPAGLPSRT